MITGMPLDIALKILAERGETPEVRFTVSPRRARAEQSGETDASCCTRVVKYERGVLTCARFHEPDPAQNAAGIHS